MFLQVEGIDVGEFRRSSLWKLRMPAVRRHVMGYEGRRILLDSGLSEADRASVLSALERLAPGNFELVVEASEAQDAVAPKGSSLLARRARVGLAIKAHGLEVVDEFAAFKREVDAAMQRPLREQQLWDAFFASVMGSSANFGVPGSGKTASVLGAFAFLRARGLVRRMVVLCPKNAFGSWRHEWAACFGGQRSCRSLCFHDAAFVHASTNTRRKELKFNAGRYDLIMVNYEALGSYVEELSCVVSSDALLVLDEVHKVKRVDGQWAMQALAIARHASRVVALTGTPIPNSYCDLYNLLHILYPQDYDSYFGYSLVTLAHPTEAETRQINHALQPFFCRTDKRMLGVPPAAPEKTYRVSATVTEQSIFESLSRAYGFEHLSLIVRMLQLESDPTMLGEPLGPHELEGMFDECEHDALQVSTVSPEVTQLAYGAPQTAKTSACVDLVERLVGEGKQVLVWCFFRRSMHNLKSLMEGRSLSVELVNGEVAQEQRDAVLSDFRQRRLQVLVTNPQTLAESVSLHDVCHDAVYFEYGYNLVHLLQSKDRIHRLGLPVGQYTQYHVLQTVFSLNGEPWSLDANIYERLKTKERAMLEAIDLGLLEVGATDAGDLELVFEGLFGS